ncbi:MAG: energy transducer TonB [Bacteroidia bacterium]|nr:energy transducer TonB [Bacteroidia bacterium]
MEPSDPPLTREEIPDPFAQPNVTEEPQPLNLEEIKSLIQYPPLAKEAGIQGKVVVRILVDEEGKYLRHLVINSPHKFLTEAVEKELPNIRFSPARLDTIPVKYWVTIPFNFKLH